MARKPLRSTSSWAVIAAVMCGLGYGCAAKPKATVEVKAAREFVVGWRTLQDYERRTGRKITEFRQSPMLDAAVKAGKLPPVRQRISEEPLVVHPLGSIGKYGGTLRLFGGANGVHLHNFMSGTRILAHDRDFKTVMPDLAKGWEFSDGGKTLTLSLRKGLRWSDGHPFTADDIMFWYEDILLNKELTPAAPSELMFAPEPIKLSEADLARLGKGELISFEKGDKARDLTRLLRGDTVRICEAQEVRFETGKPVKLDRYEPIRLAKGKLYRLKGRLIKLEKVDKWTVRIRAQGTMPLLPLRLAHWKGFQGAFFQCKHYLKQFHPRYIGPEKADALARADGFAAWDQLFRNRAYTTWNTGADYTKDCPVLDPYVLVERGLARTILERNPYYWKIDEAGNQLPYIDRVQGNYVASPLVQQLKIMAGECDFDIGFSLTLADFPILKRYEHRGGYRTLLWKQFWPAVVRYSLNLTHPDPVKRKLFNDKRFRIALSLALNRRKINEDLFFGAGKVAQATVVPDKAYSSYFEEEFATKYARYDPDEANRLLDEIGLTKRDEEGYRLGPDGKELAVVFLQNVGWTRNISIHEMAREYWAEVGIRMTFKNVGGGIMYQRLGDGNFDMCAWHMDGTCDTTFPTIPFAFVPVIPQNIWGSQWTRYYNSHGQMGEKPPPHIQRLYDLFMVMRTTMDEKERIRAGKEILRAQSQNLWCIGTVGMLPKVVIANKHLRNLPAEAPWTWDVFYASPLPPEAWYFDSEARRQNRTK